MRVAASGRCGRPLDRSCIVPTADFLLFPVPRRRKGRPFGTVVVFRALFAFSKDRIVEDALCVGCVSVSQPIVLNFFIYARIHSHVTVGVCVCVVSRVNHSYKSFYSIFFQFVIIIRNVCE